MLARGCIPVAWLLHYERPSWEYPRDGFTSSSFAADDHRNLVRPMALSTDARIQQWWQDIDAVTDRVRELTAGLGADAIAWEPAPGVWSVGQILDHVMKVNRSYEPVVAGLRAGMVSPPFTAKIPGFPRLMGAMILRTVAPASPRRVRTFPVWEPGRAGHEPSIVADFVAQQGALRSLIGDAADLLEGDPVVCSPANRTIVYHLSAAFAIIVRHEERHLGQMERTLALRRGRA